MMKKLLVVSLTLAVGLVLSACDRQETVSTGPGSEVAEINTRSAEKEFQTAEPEVRAEFDRAVVAVRSGDYSEALDRLKNLATNARLTPEQQESVRDLLGKVQDAVKRGATRAVEGASDALEDVRKSLPNNN
jgi:ABC-type enterochelin transport system substrate-binding protein